MWALISGGCNAPNKWRNENECKLINNDGNNVWFKILCKCCLKRFIKCLFDLIDTQNELWWVGNFFQWKSSDKPETDKVSDYQLKYQIFFSVVGGKPELKGEWILDLYSPGSQKHDSRCKATDVTWEGVGPLCACMQPTVHSHISVCRVCHHLCVSGCILPCPLLVRSRYEKIIWPHCKCPNQRNNDRWLQITAGDYPARDWNGGDSG